MILLPCDESTVLKSISSYAFDAKPTVFIKHSFGVGGPEGILVGREELAITRKTSVFTKQYIF